MVTWFLLIVIACLASSMVKALVSGPNPNPNPNLNPNLKLPPGPRGLPIISTLKWLTKSWLQLEGTVISLRTKFGPIISIPIGSRMVVFILDRGLTHQALVQKGAIFADRPNLSPVTRQLNITLAKYGPTWGALRRNLIGHVLHASKLKEYSHSRKWALGVLITHLSSASGNSVIKVVDYFKLGVFCLLVHMCFGYELNESKIREIQDIQRQMFVSSGRFQILNYFPRLTRILLRKRWHELLDLRKRQHEVLTPLIKSRKDIAKYDVDESNPAYVDSLLNLEIKDENHDESVHKRKLTETEIVSACSEFLNGGTDTTITTLQWIMANLVKYQDIQNKLFDEIRGIVRAGDENDVIKDDDLHKMAYLKAVVLEGLRRHPPSHFVVPHSVTHDVELGGFILPKYAIVNFNIAEMGWDPQVWEDPMVFNPERWFVHGRAEFDITGAKEIKMMPFGVGRRMCPAVDMAMLHLEYFVANLVWKFEWKPAEGHLVELTEKHEFTIKTKHPLHAYISPRRLS